MVRTGLSINELLLQYCLVVAASYSLKNYILRYQNQSSSELRFSLATTDVRCGIKKNNVTKTFHVVRLYANHSGTCSACAEVLFESPNNRSSWSGHLRSTHSTVITRIQF
jgi:hypothetical protein